MTTRPRNALEAFHPLVSEWFEECIGAPTEVQQAAWPEIADGRNVLVTAPTGSGKTLTAFLWALDRLLTGQWLEGRTRVLYVSPLKALNNDIQRNLLAPLEELQRRFAANDSNVPEVRVMTRSGDTPGHERQKMVRRPPEILITTPESLNILLASRGGRSVLSGLKTVILDEIHAVAGSKRGTHLITGIDRLVPLTGEFQRIALSATIRPLERIAKFVGGWQLDRPGEDATYRRRAVSIVQSDQAKRYELEVVYPAAEEWRALRQASAESQERGLRAGEPIAPPDTIWDHLARDFKERIRENRSTLLFANSRRATEKVTRLLNDGQPAELAYSHHGSLSREIRSVVEKRLKQGRLAAIVATNSLELGIDIGALDEVLLVQTPPTVSSAVQRIGRAGHSVGETSRGRLYPLFGRDFLDAAVMARCIEEGAIEEVQPIEAPLDVLAQIVLAMTAIEPWDLDELYDTLRTSDPYHNLSRRHFDLVIEMLAGRYSASRIRELEPRVSIDRVENTATARRGALHKIYMSGGTIPDRGYFHLRHEGSMARIGELDEEFVWERSLGDTFTLGAQQWRVKQITHNDVIVAPASGASAMAPFWKAEERNRSFHLSQQIGQLLEEAERTLEQRGGATALTTRLVSDFSMTEDAAEYLVDFLVRQRVATGVPLPHRHHLVIERVVDAEAAPDATGERQHLILHTFWGGRVNRPLAIAIAGGWEAKHGYPIEVETDNDCILLVLPLGVSVEDALEIVRPDNIETLLRGLLERTGFFGARFRENAGRALLLPRSDFRRRVPLWLSRERAKKLFDSIDKHGDFPIVVETWRTCLEDEFELEALRRVLGEIETNEIHLSQTQTSSASPFAAGLIWKQTNRLMYEDDAAEGPRSGLSTNLLHELVYSTQLRPLLPADLLDRFQRKLHRTYPGYAPRTPEDLRDWIQERIAIPTDEWTALLEAIERDGDDVDLDQWIAQQETAHVTRATTTGGLEFICTAENLVRLEAALDTQIQRRALVSREVESSAIETIRAALGDPSPSLADVVAEWLRHYGPIAQERLAAVFGFKPPVAHRALETLVESETVVVDRFRKTDASDDVARPGPEAPLEVCDAENLERLLRLLRSESRSRLAARPIEELPLFLATQQGLSQPGDGVEGLQRALESLLGYPTNAALWETDLLPARLTPYYPAWLDSLMLESDLAWFGCGPAKTTFAFEGDAELLGLGFDESEPEGKADATALLPDTTARFSLREITRHSGLSTADATRGLWSLAWRGHLSNTTFASVRRGILTRFEPHEESAPRSGAPKRMRRASRAASRWRSTRPFAGDWYVVDPGREAETLDALDVEERNKERARLLLDRYGVVFRELLERELPELKWRTLFRSLRLMELSGEVVGGHFFDGIRGLQFASTAAVRALRDGYPADAIYWMNACDPASPCGLGLEDLRGRFPPRIRSTHLVFHGRELVIVSRRLGSELDIRIDPEHPHLPDYLEFLKVLLGRQFNPMKAIDLETINGTPATTSPYTAAIASRFQATREQKCVRLRRRYD